VSKDQGGTKKEKKAKKKGAGKKEKGHEGPAGSPKNKPADIKAGTTGKKEKVCRDKNVSFPEKRGKEIGKSQ